MSSLSVAIIVLVTAMVLHLREEVRTGFRFKVPWGVMPRSVFITIKILVYGLCLAALILSFTNYDAAVYPAWVLAIAMMVNGAWHIGMMVWRRGYFPGGISAFLLLVAAGYLVAVLAG